MLGTTLLVYRGGLLQDIPGSDSLVYEVEAGNGTSVREFLYVDAFDGQIVDQISGIEQVRKRLRLSAGRSPRQAWPT